MNMLKNVAKMYCKKNPIKVAATVGAGIVAGPILGAGVLLTTAASVGGFLLVKNLKIKTKIIT